MCCALHVTLFLLVSFMRIICVCVFFCRRGSSSHLERYNVVHFPPALPQHAQHSWSARLGKVFRLWLFFLFCWLCASLWVSRGGSFKVQIPKGILSGHCFSSADAAGFVFCKQRAWCIGPETRKSCSGLVTGNTMFSVLYPI